MASAFGNLNGSGPQRVWVMLEYVNYDQAGNYSRWDWEVRYYGEGYGSWTGGTQSWSLSGFAVTSGTWEMKEADRYKTYIVLGSGRFTKGHNAAGNLAAGTMTATITTNHSSVGSGSASVSSGTPPRIPKTPSAPAAPTSVNPSATGVTFNRSAPSDNGGSSITDYDFQIASNSNFSTVVQSWSSTSASQSRSGLTRATDYWVRYRAENAVGVSSWSSAVKFTTDSRAPSTPSAPTSVNASSTGVTFNRSAPDNGGSTITGYDFQIASNANFSTIVQSWSSTAASQSRSGLTYATNYWVRYRAENAIGVSGWSSAVGFTTDAIEPAAPAAPSRTFTAPGTIELAWSAPSNNGSSILEYQVRYANNSGMSGATSVSTGTTRSRTVTGLSIGTTWYFQVRARNAIGWGAWSSSASYAIPPVPDAPGGVARAFTAPRQVTVTWNAAAGNGASILEYQVQTANNSGFTSPSTYSTGTSRTHTRTDYALGTTHYWRVRARSSQGWGAWSSSVSYAVPNVPAKPANPVLSEVKPTSMKATWVAPSNGGSAITGYDVQIATAANMSGATTVSQTGLSLTRTGLTPGTTYYWRVRAKSAQGEGAWSDVVSAKTPSGLYHGQGASFVPVEWFVGKDGVFVPVEWLVGEGGSFVPLG